MKETSTDTVRIGLLEPGDTWWMVDESIGGDTNST